MMDKVALWRTAQWGVWGGIVLLTLFTLLYVLNALLVTPWMSPNGVASPVLPGMNRFNNSILFVHVVTAYPCLLLGPWLFLPALRKRHLWLHRRLGQGYVFGVLISAMLGFLLATVNPNGVVAKAGFASLAVVWFSTTYIGYKTIRARKWRAHRRWMIRSYAISIAVITIRFLPSPEWMEYSLWYPLMTWACWVPNYILAETYIQLTDDRGLPRSFSKKADLKAGRSIAA